MSVLPFASPDPVDLLDLGIKARNALSRGGFTTISQIEAATDWELTDVRGLGHGLFAEIRAAVDTYRNAQTGSGTKAAA